MGTASFEARRCDHPSRWWRVPWSGEAYEAPHPRLRGRQAAIAYDQWRPTMLRDREPKGDFITKAAAAYPAALNEHLAQSFVAWRPDSVRPAGGTGCSVPYDNFGRFAFARPGRAGA